MKRLFVAFAALALSVGIGNIVLPRAGLEAATPLPSGCYTDATGLPVCGPNYPGPGGGGGGNIIVPGVCTSPSPVPSPTGGVAVNYTCATPGPQATPSPSATGCGFWSGSWPYNLDTTTCGGGGGGGFTNLVCTAPVVCSPSAGPTPAISVTTPTPLPCPTAGANVTITGTQMPACSIASSGGGGSGGTGFIFPLRQAPAYAYSYSSGTIAVNYATTPTSGDFLMAITVIDLSKATTTPSGWTSWFISTGSSGTGFQVFYKTSNGTETGFSATTTSAWAAALYDFSGSRTVDTYNAPAPGTSLFVAAPTLTSPSSGAGVVCLFDFGWNNSNILASQTQLTSPDASWVTNTFNDGGGFQGNIFAFWTGKVGTNLLGYPNFLYLSEGIINLVNSSAACFSLL